MTIPASEAALIPLPTDDDVLERVRMLLGRGLRRQLWLLFLDAEERQLPLLLPSELPARPRPDDDAGLASFLRQLVDDQGAASVVLVLERPGPATLGDADRAWVRVLVAAADAAGVRLRGPLLVSTRGPRWIDPEDRA